MRFKRGLLVSLLVLFLAACGTQTQAPAIPTAEESLGEINVAELEAAFDATELTDQSNWNKKKYNKFTLKKIVEGYGPEHQVYKLAVICKVPSKKNVLAVVGAAYLKDGQSKHFLVPTKYVKCAAFEFEKFGDEVKFELEQKKYDQYSDVEYYGKLKVWGKKLDFKASEFFHLKRGDAKFIVINKFVKAPVKEKLELILKKEFRVGYNGYEVHPKDLDLKIRLICDGKVVAETDQTYYKTHVYADEVKGKHCELKESFVSYDYEAFQYSVAYDDGYKTPERTYNDCKDGHCEYSRYGVSEYAKKLVIVITNNVIVKEEKPHTSA